MTPSALGGAISANSALVASATTWLLESSLTAFHSTLDELAEGAVTKEQRTPARLQGFPRGEFIHFLSEELALLDDDIRAQWFTFAITPQKWRCSPWSDDSDGFWAVAISDQKVVWYNDIEEGFNVSSFSSYGVISTYACEQHTLGESLAASGLAVASEGVTRLSASKDIPKEFDGAGRIEKRQTTYWSVRTKTGRWKIHFSGKKEVRFVHPDFMTVKFTSEHPLLNHYQQHWGKLCVSARTRDPVAVLRQLEAIVLASSNGYRQLTDYLNGSTEVANAVLTQGFGCILEAPESVVLQSKEALERDRLRPTIIARYRIEEEQDLRVLFLGENLIVARAFRFEAP